jgi:hypothetical protein
MSMRAYQILGGSSDLNDKFGFGMQTVCTPWFAKLSLDLDDLMTKNV